MYKWILLIVEMLKSLIAPSGSYAVHQFACCFQQSHFCKNRHPFWNLLLGETASSLLSIIRSFNNKVISSPGYDNRDLFLLLGKRESTGITIGLFLPGRILILFDTVSTRVSTILWLCLATFKVDWWVLASGLWDYPIHWLFVSLLLGSLHRAFPSVASLDTLTGPPLSTIKPIRISNEAIFLPSWQRVFLPPLPLVDLIQVAIRSLFHL